MHFTTFSTGNTKGIINDRFSGLYGAKDGTLYATTTEDGVLTVYRERRVHVLHLGAGARAATSSGWSRTPPARSGSWSRTTTASTKTWYYLRDGAFVLPETIDPDAEVVTLTGPDGASWTVTPQQAVERRDGKDDGLSARHPEASASS